MFFHGNASKGKGIKSTTLANLGSALNAGLTTSVTDANNAVISNENGLWLGKRRIVFVKSGSESYSSFNTQQLQTALDLGGIVEVVSNVKGSTVYFDASVNAVACIAQPSNTTLIAPEDVVMRTASGVLKPLIVSKATKDCLAGLTKTAVLSWAAGLTLTVTVANHGLSVGKYASLFKTSVANVDELSFAGTFRVTGVTDANTFTVNLDRTPTAAPVNTTQWGFVEATSNAKLIGGIWDYNYAGNPVSIQSLNRMTMIYWFGAHNYLDPAMFQNTNKYCITVGCDRASVVNKCIGNNANSDGVKFYGPLFQTRCNYVGGQFGDDGFSCQAYEKDDFSGYRLSWGDCIGVRFGSMDAVTSAGAVVVYTEAVSGCWTDDFKVEGSIKSNRPSRVYGTVAKQGNAGSLDFGTLRGSTTTPVFQGILGYAQHVKFKTNQPVAAAGAVTVNMQSDFKVDRLDAELDVHCTTTSSTQYISLDGEIGSAFFSGEYKTGSNAKFVQSGSTVNCSIGFISFDKMRVAGAGVLFRNLSGRTTETVVSVRDSDLTVTNVVENSSTTNTLKVRVSGNNLVNATRGFVFNSSASVTTLLSMSTDNALLGTSISNNANGGTITTTVWS